MDDGNEDDVTQALEQLEMVEQHRLDCEARCEYNDAERHRATAAKLKQHIQNRHKKMLDEQQKNELKGIEEARRAEEKEFDEIWLGKQKEFKAHASNLQKTLEERHRREWEAQMEELNRTTEPRTPRWSPKLLDLRKICERFAKQKKYTEAAKTKEQADALEKQELDLWRVKREEKIATLEAGFMKKQQLEMGGLLKRIESGMQEQQQARQTERDRLLQRYNNVKVQLASQQRIISQSWEKYGYQGHMATMSQMPSKASGGA